MKNIVVLVSGSGTNLQRIIDCTKNGEIKNAEVVKVVADRDCFALQRAANESIKTELVKRSKNFHENLIQSIPEKCDLIALAGFLSILSADFTSKFEGKIINIHPALLPKFGGKGMWGSYVHQAVIKAGEKQSGATVHYVTEGVDEGMIIMQGKVDLENNETVESLAEKVHQIEHNIYPKAINKFLNE